MANDLPVLKLFSLAIILLVTGCSGATDNGGAYIYTSGEFNRASSNFAKTPQDIDSVTICYNKYGTSPEKIATMAKLECAKFNKQAIFIRHSYEVCPLFTPVAAVYNCRGGK